jgi:PelA/Pel-15E family pectate lyase
MVSRPKLFSIIVIISVVNYATTGSGQPIPIDGFSDGINHYRNEKETRDYARLGPDQYREIAENILLYQRSSGGWPKNWDPLRILPENDRRLVQSKKEAQDTTLDNRSTYPQIEYLAEAYQRSGDDRFRNAALNGIKFLFEAQGEHGGWPHAYPRTGGYNQMITFNDSVMIGVLSTIRKIAAGNPPYDFVPLEDIALAQAALQRGLDLILQLQIESQGTLTAWAQQYDPETLKPVTARSYELPAIASGESVGVVRFLMDLPEPSSEVIDAIEQAIAWFQRSAILGLRIDKISLETPIRYEFHTADFDRIEVDDPSAPAIWSRFYDLDSNRPFMANRDGTKVFRLADVHHERRTGYGWYTYAPQALLEKAYPAWRERILRAKL